MRLQHKTSRTIFKYVGKIKPQFTNAIYVELLNEKTGKVERFIEKTYKQYFTELTH